MLSKNALCSLDCGVLHVIQHAAHTATSHYILPPSPLDYHSRTMILENESDISLGVGPKWDSGKVETPAPILSSIIFNITWGTLSSVARIVRRTICGTN